MHRDTHFTAAELEALHKNAVLACADYELALQFNQYLTDNGIEPVVSESWSTRLSRKLAKPFQGFPIFSVSE